MIDFGHQAIHTVAQLILDGDWHTIEKYAYPKSPYYRFCDRSFLEAARQALDIYEDYLGYHWSDIILQDRRQYA